MENQTVTTKNTEANETELQKALKTDKEKFIDIFSLIGRYTCGERDLTRMKSDGIAMDVIISIKRLCEAISEIDGYTDECVISYYNFFMESSKGQYYQSEGKVFFDSLLRFLLVIKHYQRDASQIFSAMEDIEQFMDEN